MICFEMKEKIKLLENKILDLKKNMEKFHEFENGKCAFCGEIDEEHRWEYFYDKYNQWIDKCPHCEHTEFRRHKKSPEYVVCLGCKKLSVKRNT